MTIASPSTPSALPHVTADVPPVPGVLRTSPEDFEVSELPAYAPSGEGEHLFLRIRKRDLTTPQAVRRLAEALGVDPGAAGWAGLKDRHAVTEQWVSLHRADPSGARELALEGVEILEAVPHEAKLRTGHLRGNRSRLRVRGPPADRLADVERVLELLSRLGVPNYFGEQRFGREQDNYIRAHRWIVEGGRPPRARFDRKLLASAFQAELFNRRVAARVRAGALGRIEDGDLVRKEDTGGLFVVEDVSEAQGRADAWLLSPTGPMFGPKMRWPERAARGAEEALLAEAGVAAEHLSRLGRSGEGTRRPVRIRPLEASLEPCEDGFVVAFTLPKGAYATVVMEEVLKQGATTPEKG